MKHSGISQRMTMIDAFKHAQANLHRNPVVVGPDGSIPHGYVIDAKGFISHHISSMTCVPSLNEMASDMWRVVFDDQDQPVSVVDTKMLACGANDESEYSHGRTEVNPLTSRRNEHAGAIA